jgi:hypothetical protein
MIPPKVNKLHNDAGCNPYVSKWMTVLQDLYKILDDYERRDAELYGFSGAVAIPTLPWLRFHMSHFSSAIPH